MPKQKFDEELINLMMDSIIQVYPSYKGLRATWNLVECFNQPFLRANYRRHFLEAMDRMGIHQSELF